MTPRAIRPLAVALSLSAAACGSDDNDAASNGVTHVIDSVLLPPS